MKIRTLMILGAALLTPSFVAADTKAGAAKPPVLSTEKQKMSYAMGARFAENMKKDELDLDPDVVGLAIKDVVNGRPMAMTEKQMADIVQVYRKRREKEMAARAEKSRKEGVAFLAKNKKQPGVVTTKSGLQYKILKTGTGPRPTDRDKVTMHWRGSLLDGREFDSSYKRGAPAEHSASSVFAGWQEALKLMPEGSHWIVWVPPALAFGEQGLGNVVPANATLVMDIDLVKVEPLYDEKGEIKK